MNKNKPNKLITLFLIYAFGIPLLCIIIEKYISLFQHGIFKFTLYGIEAMSPTISALIVTAVSGGIIGISEFLKKCYIRNVKIQYIILAAVVPASCIIVTKLLMVIFIGDTFTISKLTANKLIIILWALIAEELGWRGFLQEKIDKYFGFLLTPFILGSIWALWHYHFFISGTMSAPLILFALGCISDSYSFYWITKKSSYNIIPASVFHCTENFFFSLFLISPEYNNGSSLPYLFYTVCSALTAIVITIWGCNSERKLQN